MATINAALEHEILENIRLLSTEKQQEVLDFVTFLLEKVGTSQPREEQVDHSNEADSVDVVERTWGNLALDRDTLIYIAEDKELEYDV